jgi:uncharacterized protein YyaL (SSP411 family)
MRKVCLICAVFGLFWAATIGSGFSVRQARAAGPEPQSAGAQPPGTDGAKAQPDPSPSVSPPSINWMAWGSEAFDKARSEDKLVFLDISATWCHWCAVMEETTYKDPEVIKLINEKFVPVYVDSDMRPDISDRYNQGGWPSVAILTPTGQVLAGGTTMTADELRASLGTVNKSYHENRELVYRKLEAARKASDEERAKKSQPGGPPNPEMSVRVLDSVNLFSDPVYGGFGGPEKFPTPEVYEFALYVYPKARDIKEKSPKAAIDLALKGIAGGLLDRVEGGFFRYSTSPDWKTPHYEKLLSTNADLLGLYMRAYQLMGTEDYRDAAVSAASYMQKVLYDKSTGAFFNSQAADEKYYTQGGSGRSKIVPPPVNRVIYADSNAKAAIGFLAAYRATGDARYLNVALGVVDFIMDRLYKKGEGVSHSPGSAPGVMNLSDQVYTALAASHAYQATGDRKYLELSEDLAAVMDARFRDPEKGGFYGAAYGPKPLGLLGDREKPQIENSKASALMMELYHITGTEAYRQSAKRALAPFTAEYMKYTYWAAPFALAVARVVEPAYEFVVIGKKDNPGTAELIKTSYTFEDPDRVVVPLDPERDKNRLESLGYEYGDKPVLYVCSEKTCFPPVSPGQSLKKTRQYMQKAAEQEKK